MTALALGFFDSDGHQHLWRLHPSPGIQRSQHQRRFGAAHSTPVEGKAQAFSVPATVDYRFGYSFVLVKGWFAKHR